MQPLNTFALYFFILIVAPIIALALMYPLAIQYQRGGLWRVLTPLAFVAAIIDVWANYTGLALLTWDAPKEGERTFSQRCARLIRQTGWAGSVGRLTQAYCNFFMKGHIE